MPLCKTKRTWALPAPMAQQAAVLCSAAAQRVSVETDEAISWLRANVTKQHKHSPWYVQVWFREPHAPVTLQRVAKLADTVNNSAEFMARTPFAHLMKPGVPWERFGPSMRAKLAAATAAAGVDLDALGQGLATYLLNVWKLDFEVGCGPERGRGRGLARAHGRGQCRGRGCGCAVAPIVTIHPPRTTQATLSHSSSLILTPLYYYSHLIIVLKLIPALMLYL